MSALSEPEVIQLMAIGMTDDVQVAMLAGALRIHPPHVRQRLIDKALAALEQPPTELERIFHDPDPKGAVRHEEKLKRALELKTE